MKTDRMIGLGFAAVLLALGAGMGLFSGHSAAPAPTTGPEAPKFEVDPLWPKPLPNHWRIGSTIGVSVDAKDHVWVLHRPATLQPKEAYASQSPRAAICCSAAPPVLEFDSDGTLLNSWGGPAANPSDGYEWPVSNHGLTIDYKGNVWIGGNDEKDSQVLKFTQAGKFLMQIGHSGQSKGSNDTANVHRAAKIFVDPEANEAYIADGYGNKRVIVYDAEPMATSPTTPTPARTIPARRPLNNSATPCIAPNSRMTDCSTSAIAPMIASRSSKKMAPSSKNNSSPKKPWATEPSSTSPSPRTPRRSSSTWPTDPMTASTSCCATRWRN